MRRKRIAILETTFVVCMICVGPSLFTRGSTAMFAKMNFSIYFFIAGFSARFRFEIGSVCSLPFLSERSFLFFFLSEEDDFCLSNLFELFCFSFGLAKDGASRPSGLVCCLRYCVIALSGLYCSNVELSLVTSFCNVFSLNSPSLRYLSC